MEYERDNPSDTLTISPSERTDSSVPLPREARPVVSGTKGTDGKTYYNDIRHNPELAQYFD